MDIVAPVYQSGYFESTTITLIYSEVLRTSTVPSSSSFTVSVLTGTRWIARSVTAVTINGNTVTLIIGGGSMM
jgi:energy-converting hydrogenase Eha subunit A